MSVKKLFLPVCIIMLISIIVSAILFLSVKPEEQDNVAINDISEYSATQWSNLSRDNGFRYKPLDYNLDYVIIDKNGKVLYATSNNLSTTVNDAVKHGDMIIDIEKNGEILGKAIFYDRSGEIITQRTRLLFICNLILIIAAGLLLLLYLLYLNKNVFKPFKEMKSFAERIATGNFDIPLNMNRGNLFGAFTESFDIMREELAKAQENERKANESKKQLVAQLSHDIKTPVASIEAISELMSVKMPTEKERKQIESIHQKAEQIDLLISNMFQATLEELEELKVAPEEHPSTMLPDMIRKADYKNRAVLEEVPECIIMCDALRLQQVFDNVISNSYKYADTDIDVKFFFDGNKLVVSILDYGPGILPRNISKIFNRFYRGENTQGIEGSGLGLFIAKSFMTQMDGDVECYNTDDGFGVDIFPLIS